MIEDVKSFERIIREIIKENCSFGNQLLYDICVDKKEQQWGNFGVLADKIWLIGRSYAASPERRYTYKSECKDKDRTNDNVGDGTGEYFESVAKYILNTAKNTPRTINILNNGYLFDFSNSDCETLFIGINSVLKFNKLIVNASANYDGIEFANKVNYRNQVSFCSKFLHFHFPETIFIIDSFSKKGASYLFSKGTRTSAVVKHSNGEVKISNAKKGEPKGAINLLLDYQAYVSNYKMFKKEFVKKLEELKLDSHGIEYAKHCLRAYKIACLFKMFSEDELPSCSYPRIVDTLLLKIQSI